MQVIHLNSPWFELVKDGKKIYEGRRNTAFTRSLKIGQNLEIKHYIDRSISPYTVTISDFLYFKTFEEALINLPIDQVLPIENITIQNGVDIYKQFVSLDTQLKDGVVMIKVIVK